RVVLPRGTERVGRTGSRIGECGHARAYARVSLHAVGMTDDGIAALRRTTRCPGRGLLWNERRCRSAPAEQRTAQSAQRREEQHTADPVAPGTALTWGVTRGQLTHQRSRLGRLALRDGRAAEHREMAVEARTGRAAPAGDRRDPGPAAHCYLFHVTPHPYES